MAELVPGSLIEQTHDHIEIMKMCTQYLIQGWLNYVIQLYNYIIQYKPKQPT